MTELTTLESLARDHLLHECHGDREAIVAVQDGSAACPALWLLRDLVSLLEEFRDRPLTDLAPMVRRLILEQNFVDENGDSVFDTQCAKNVEHEVALILRALERTRREATEQGILAQELACTEQWFG